MALAVGLSSACGDDPASNDAGSTDMGSPGEVFEGPFDLAQDVEVIDFGDVQAQTDSEARIVSLRNVGGEDIIDLQAMEGVGFLRGTFSFSLAANSLAPGASTELRVVFSPAELGPASSMILLLASDGQTMRSYGVDLEGVGIPSEVVVTTGSLNFDMIQVGLDGTRSFGLRNDGSVSRTVEFSFSANVSMCAGDASLFCLVPPNDEFRETARLELASGAAQSFEVRFLPPASGSFSASIGYECLDFGCGGEIALQGSGQEIGIPGG
ncbi:MAG: choice-of-anchor D domain-containing protein [Myxococcota bacterium]